MTIVEVAMVAFSQRNSRGDFLFALAYFLISSWVLGCVFGCFIWIPMERFYAAILRQKLKGID
jgi:hypothetical protein